MEGPIGQSAQIERRAGLDADSQLIRTSSSLLPSLETGAVRKAKPLWRTGY